MGKASRRKGGGIDKKDETPPNEAAPSHTRRWALFTGAAAALGLGGFGANKLYTSYVENQEEEKRVTALEQYVKNMIGAIRKQMAIAKSENKKLVIINPESHSGREGLLNSFLQYYVSRELGIAYGMELGPDYLEKDRSELQGQTEREKWSFVDVSEAIEGRQLLRTVGQFDRPINLVAMDLTEQERKAAANKMVNLVNQDIEKQLGIKNYLSIGEMRNEVDISFNKATPKMKELLPADSGLRAEIKALDPNMTLDKLHEISPNLSQKILSVIQESFDKHKTTINDVRETHVVEQFAQRESAMTTIGHMHIFTLAPRFDKTKMRIFYMPTSAAVYNELSQYGDINESNSLRPYPVDALPNAVYRKDTDFADFIKKLTHATMLQI